MSETFRYNPNFSSSSSSSLLFYYLTALVWTGLESIYNWILKRLCRLTFSILCCGPIPSHIAFIMDGNRRYASLRRFSNRIEGHLHGFRRLENVLQWCWDLGIPEVTIYAFSIENFKRSPEEVEMLMSLAKEKLDELSLHSELIHKNKVCIRVIGELELLPQNVRNAACNAMLRTRQYQQNRVNVCMPYTSTAEIIAVGKALSSANLGDDIQLGPDHLTELMWTGIPDIIVRTSGEQRLSDFLTWQTTCGNNNGKRLPPMLAFVNVLWPDFGLFEMVKVLLRYQVWIKGAKQSNFEQQPVKKHNTTPPREWREFVQLQTKLYWDRIISFAQSSDPAVMSPPPSSPEDSPKLPKK